MNKQKLRVWHIPQVPGETFYVIVESPEEAIKVMSILSIYDQFQFQNNIKPDFSNANGLEYYNEDEKEWNEWYSEDDLDINEYEEEIEDKSVVMLVATNKIKF